MRKVYKAWDGNHIWVFHLNMSVTVSSWPPNLAKHGKLWGYSDQKTYTHGCIQPKDHFKVIFQQARIMMNGMGIVHGILSQPQHFLQANPQFWPKTTSSTAFLGPNDMCKWLQIAEEAFQSPYWFMSKVYKAWDGNCTWYFHPNIPFSAKLTPKFQKRPIGWLLWPKPHVCMIVDCCRSIPMSK